MVELSDSPDGRSIRSFRSLIRPPVLNAAVALRRRMSTRTRQRIGRVGVFFGPSSMDEFRESLVRLRQAGFDPRLILDIGAFTGAWARMCAEVFPSSVIVMVEPQEALSCQLEALVAKSAGRMRHHSELLGPTDGAEVTFFEMSTGSSVFEEQSPYPRSRTSRTTRRLDAVLAEDSDRVDLIKLDVQGFELEVLEGAPRSLRSAQVVLLEASLIPINTGAPLFADVVAWMSDAGFRLVDIPSISRRRDGALWQSDLLFIREGSLLLPYPRLTRSNWG